MCVSRARFGAELVAVLPRRHILHSRSSLFILTDSPAEFPGPWIVRDTAVSEQADFFQTSSSLGRLTLSGRVQPRTTWASGSASFRQALPYSVKAKHDSQRIFQCFEFGGFSLDGGSMTEVLEYFEVKHGLHAPFRTLHQKAHTHET